MGIPEHFSAVAYYSNGSPRGVLLRDGTVELLEEPAAMRIIEQAKRGTKAFFDFIPGLDKALSLEVPDEKVEQLEAAVSRLKTLQSDVEAVKQEIRGLVEKILKMDSKVEYIKLHVFPARDKQLFQSLQQNLGNPGPDQWFFSQKFQSYVFHPSLQQKLEDFLKTRFKGKYLLKKGCIWSILDRPFQDAIEL
ncbi:MAG: hypothetical protein QW356_04930 [Candidatus Hadarchaeales archaeon]